MFDRITLNLRMADHATTTARIDATGWRRRGEPKRRALRPALATALVALAARLGPARAGVQRFAQPV